MSLALSGSVSISGSLNVGGSAVILSSATSSLSASYAINAVTASYVVSSVTDASQNTRLNAIEAVTGSYATTGSNQFNGNQVITGSLTATGTITAQTLVVQTITSSVDFVTGSTRFGSTTGNTHQFTGSMLVSGSQTLNGALSGTSATFSSNVNVTANNDLNEGIAASIIRQNGASGNNGLVVDVTNAPNAYIADFRLANSSVFRIGSTGAATFSSSVTSDNLFKSNAGIFQIFAAGSFRGGLYNYASAIGSGTDYSPSLNSETNLYFTTGGSGTQKMVILSNGNVGIGTNSPEASLHISGSAAGLRVQTNNNYEIIFAGTDSVNIYHSTADQSMYLNTNGGSLFLGTTSASTLFTISGSNVGIGTINPASLLHLYNANISTQLRIQSDLDQAGLRLISGTGSTNRASRIDFLNGVASSTVPRWSLINDYNQNGTNDFSIVTDNPGVRAVVITQAGNIGIGITTPDRPLDIYNASLVGIARIRGNNQDGAAITIQNDQNSQAVSIYSIGSSGFGVNGWANNALIESLTGIVYSAFNGNHIFQSGTSGRTERMRITSGGNLQIGTTSSSGAKVLIYDNRSNSTSLDEAALYVRQDGTNPIQTWAGGGANERMRITSGGNVGIGRTSPRSLLAIYGGPIQIMQDYVGHQTIIRSVGAVGSFSGALTITIPEMEGAGSSQGFGGYSCEVYVSGFSGAYCHAWFSGYVNNGITTGEVTILRSNGGWSISQSSTGTWSQGFVFTLDYASIVHPTARIIFNKGGDQSIAEYTANNITASFS
jgi:hypothetical protein